MCVSYEIKRITTHKFCDYAPHSYDDIKKSFGVSYPLNVLFWMALDLYHWCAILNWLMTVSPEKTARYAGWW